MNNRPQNNKQEDINMKYYVIERNNNTHIKAEKPIEYYDFFCRHERGNVIGEETFYYDDISQTEAAADFIRKALEAGYEIQTWNGWHERVNIIGIEGR